jgi:phage tail-like protein
MRWNLLDAWPSEWQSAALNTTDRAVAIDTLTLVFDALERA